MSDAGNERVSRNLRDTGGIVNQGRREVQRSREGRYCRGYVRMRWGRASEGDRRAEEPINNLPNAVRRRRQPLMDYRHASANIIAS